MPVWVSTYLPTVIVGVLVLAAVILAVRSLLRGRHTGGCGDCPGCGQNSGCCSPGCGQDISEENRK